MKKKKAVKKTAKKKTSKRKPNAAFMKPLKPSPTLAAIIGETAIPRPQVYVKIWAYIHKHSLQDKVKRKMINADAKMKPLFNGKSKVDMFEMVRCISKHLK